MSDPEFFKNVIAETSKIGLDITDIAGDVETLSKSSIGLVHLANNISHSSQNLLSGSQSVSDRVEGMQYAIQSVAKDIYESKGIVKASTKDLIQFVSNSRSIAEQVTSLRSDLERIAGFTAGINQITERMDMLSTNAINESSRVGGAGQSCAELASEVRGLAANTSETHTEIGALLASLIERTSTLVSACDQGKIMAQNMMDECHELNSKMDDVSHSFGKVEALSSLITREVKGIHAQADITSEGVDGLRDEVNVSDHSLGAARERINRLIGSCEKLVSVCVASYDQSEDGQILEKLKSVAKSMEDAFEKAVQKREISIDDLFDENYVSIPKTKPQQVKTKFVEITDKYLPKIQEAALEINSHVVFCAAVDRNGYLPTHNLEFSKPQGDNPIWNAANCRNRRMFNDRVGLAAGRNTQPFLIQMYRRDMGGGNFVLMKDMSIPLYIRGRHWGGVRLAYLVEGGI